MRNFMLAICVLAVSVSSAFATTITSGTTTAFSEISKTEPLIVEAGGTLDYTSSSSGNFTHAVTLSGTGNGVVTYSGTDYPRGAIRSSHATTNGFSGDVTIAGPTSVFIDGAGCRIRFFGNVSGDDLTLYARGGENCCLVFNPSAGKSVQLKSLTVESGKPYYSVPGVFCYADGITIKRDGFFEVGGGTGEYTFRTSPDGPLTSLFLETDAELDLKNHASLAVNVVLNGDAYFRSAGATSAIITWKEGTFSGTGSMTNTSSRRVVFSDGVAVNADLVNGTSSTYTFDSGSTLGADVNNSAGGNLNLNGITVTDDATVSGKVTALAGTTTIMPNAMFKLTGGPVTTDPNAAVVNHGTLYLDSVGAFSVKDFDLDGKLVLKVEDAADKMTVTGDLLFTPNGSIVVDMTGFSGAVDTVFFQADDDLWIKKTADSVAMSDALAYYFFNPVVGPEGVTFQVNAAAIPEPATWLLLVLSWGGGVLWVRSVRRSRAWA